MPTVGYVDATNIKVLVGETQIAKITSGTLALSADERDRRNNDGNGWMERGYGTLSSSISGDAFFEFDAGYGYEDLFDALVAKTKLALTWNAGTSGDIRFKADYILNQLDQSGNTGEDLKYSYTFNSTSPVTKETIPAPAE